MSLGLGLSNGQYFSNHWLLQVGIGKRELHHPHTVSHPVLDADATPERSFDNSIGCIGPVIQIAVVVMVYQIVVYFMMPVLIVVGIVNMSPPIT